jgi:outer membrane autotransporter protein
VIPNDFSGTLTGTGTFTSLGRGAFTCSGSIDLIGGTSAIILREGAFLVNGTASAETVTVLGGRLGGTGTITSIMPIQIDAGGTVGPGNSIGPLHIAGDIIFNPSSFLQIELNPTDADELFATGTVDVGNATLFIIPDPGTYTTGTIYNIVSAPTINSPFAGVEVSSASATRNFSVIYSSDLIQLAVNTLSFSSVFGCSTSNAALTATAYETTNPNNPDFLTISNFLHEANAAQIQCDFDQMQLALFNAIPITQESAATAMRAIYTDRLQEIHGPYCELKERNAEQQEPSMDGEAYDHLNSFLPIAFRTAPQKSKRTKGIWIAPFRNFNKQKSRSQEGECDQTKIGFHSSSNGFIIGIDREVGEKGALDHVILGASYSYAHTELDWRESQADSDAKTHLGTLYGSFFYKAFYLNAIFMGGSARVNAKRQINLVNPFGTITRTARHHNSTGEFDGHLELGFLWNPGCSQFRPYGSLDYVYLHEDGYREKGAESLNFVVRVRNSKLLREELGLSFSFWQNGQSHSWSQEIKLGYVSEERFRGEETQLRFVDSPDNFEVAGFSPNRNLFAPNATLSIHWLNGFSISGSYSGEFGKKWSNQTAYLKLLLEF